MNAQNAPRIISRPSHYQQGLRAVALGPHTDAARVGASAKRMLDTTPNLPRAEAQYLQGLVDGAALLLGGP